MKRVLVMPCPTHGGTLGSVGYLLAICEKLRNRCELLVHASGYSAKLMRSYGFQVVEAVAPVTRTGTRDIRDLIDAMEWMGLLDEQYIQKAVEDEIEFFKRFRPDIILSDFHLTAPISAKCCQTPIVSLAAEPTHPRFGNSRYGYLSERFNIICEKLNLRKIEDVRELCYLWSDIPIATTWEEFEPGLKTIPNIVYVGALIHESHRTEGIHWDTSKNKIFVYLSVSALPPRVYIPILKKAFPEQQFEIICSVGSGYDIEPLKKDAGHIRLYNWAPINDLLPDADLVIYHGGQGTGMAAVFHGVPSIAVPGENYERKFNAERFESLGLGVSLRTENFRPGILRETYQKLQSKEMKEKVYSASQTIKPLGGAQKVAEIILNDKNTFGGLDHARTSNESIYS